MPTRSSEPSADAPGRAGATILVLHLVQNFVRALLRPSPRQPPELRIRRQALRLGHFPDVVSLKINRARTLEEVLPLGHFVSQVF
jgi:hypothetical protein